MYERDLLQHCQPSESAYEPFTAIYSVNDRHGLVLRKLELGTHLSVAPLSTAEKQFPLKIDLPCDTLGRILLLTNLAHSFRYNRLASPFLMETAA